MWLAGSQRKGVHGPDVLLVWFPHGTAELELLIPVFMSFPLIINKSIIVLLSS